MIFANAAVVGRPVREPLFEHGLCLPSGSNMTAAEQDRVIDVVLGLARDR